MKLAPSILSADFADLKTAINDLKNAGIDTVHIDVMDGNFVSNISIGQPVVKSLRKITNMIFDVHLMIEEPIRYIDDFASSGADIITVHQEAALHLDKTLNRIKELGKKAGVSLNPATPASSLEDVLYLADLVLIMSVNPGFGGQKFIPNAVNKIKKLVQLRKQQNLKFLIEVDGGINEKNIGEVCAAGADLIVAGSSVFNAERSVRENIDLLRNAAK